MSDNKDVKRGIVLYLDGKEVVNNVTSIKTELRKLTKDLDGMAIGSKKYVEQTKKIQSLKAILNEHNAQLRNITTTQKEQQSLLSKGINLFNKYAAVVATGIAGLTGLTFTIRKAVDAYAEMEEAESQVRKYTGMTVEEVKELNEEFKRMDTRTAREKLNALAGDAGRLGITSKKEVLEFVDAADKINVALGEDLGEDAVKNIGKLAQMFGEDEKLGLRGAMLATGSAINEVAQNSSAAEAYLVGFTARVAGAANQAKVAQGDILGYASVLDQNMQQQEMAATAFQTLMMKMYQEPAKFAKLAGKNVLEFTTLIKKNANEAILQFLDTLSKRGGLDKLAPMFKEMGLDGVRASGVISTMAGKIDDIRTAQKLANDAYRDGTSIINEFNVQNNTVQAGMDKAKIKFHNLTVELGEKLLPIARNAISLGSLTVKGLKAITDILTENGVMIASVSALWLIYATRLKIVSAYHTLLLVGKGIQLAYAAAVATISGKAMLAVARIKELSTVLAGYTVILRTLRAVMYLSISAISLFTGNIQRATAAFRAFSAVIRVNTLGVLLTIVTAIAAALYSYIKYVSNAKTITEEFYASVMKERSELDQLYGALMRSNTSQAERKRLIDEFNDNFGKYLSNLLDEKSTIEDIKKAYGEAVVAMNDYYAKELLNKKTADIFSNNAEKEAKLLSQTMHGVESMTKSQQARVLGFVNEITNTMLSANVDESSKNITDTIFERLQTEMGSVSKLFGNTTYGWDEFAHSLTPYIEKVSDRLTEINQIKDQLAPFFKRETTTLNELPEVVVTAGYKGSTPPETDKEKNKRIREEQKRIEAEYLKKQSDLREQYMKSDTMSRQDYANELEKLEFEKLNKLMEIAGLEPAKREAINQKIIDAKLKLYEKIQDMGRTNAIDDESTLNSELERIQKDYDKKLALLEYAFKKQVVTIDEYNKQKHKIEKDANDERNKANEKASHRRLEKEELIYKKEQLTLRRARMKENLTDEQYTKSLRKSRIKWLERMLSDLKLSEEDRIQVEQEYNDLSVEEEEDKYEKAKVLAGKYASLAEDIATEFGETIGEMIAEGEFSMKEFLKETILMALDALERVIEICCIEVMAKNMAATAPFSFIGAAKAAIQIAAIKAAFSVAKGLVSNFYTGGYTGDGNWDDPKGVVHSNEFVANRFAVANPAIRPVLDLIDNAQRTGSIANLTADDITAVSAGGTHEQKNVMIMPASTKGDSVDSSELLHILRVLNLTMNKAQEAYEKPSPAYCWAEGKGGVNDAQRLVDKMKSNVKRV